MRVKFVLPWQGSQPGDIGEYASFITDDLIARKIAEPYIENDKRDAEIAELKKQNAILKGRLTKQTRAAPVDKQVKGAANK